MIRNQRVSLSILPTISYPYRLIHSFFAIFEKKFEYNKIKNAVLKINDWNNDYLKYYLLYSALFSADDGKTINCDLYKDLFQSIFNKEIKSDLINEINNFLLIKNKQIVIAKLINKIKECKMEQGYLVFLILSKFINISYSSLIVLPVDLLDDMCFVQNEYILGYYINGVIVARKRHINDDDLIYQLQSCYANMKDHLERNLGIKAIYLFGSIASGEYHRESDIDLVIEVKNRETDFSKIVKEISSFNLSVFKRPSDIYEYTDFKKNNPHIDLRLLKF